MYEYYRLQNNGEDGDDLDPRPRLNSLQAGRDAKQEENIMR